MEYIVCVDSDPVFLKFIEEGFNGITIDYDDDDDEPVTLELFEDPIKAVAWMEGLNMKTVEIAVIMSSSKMPGMPGLQFFKRVKPLSPQAKILLFAESEGVDIAINALNSNLLDKFYLKSEANDKDELGFILCSLLSTYRMERVAYIQKGKMEKMLELQRQHLIQSDRMASVGVMAAGVAHEINNPLNVLSGDMHLLQRDLLGFIKIIKAYKTLTLTPDESVIINKIKEEIDLEYLLDHYGDKTFRLNKSLKRIANIVDNLRSFSHLDTGEKVASLEINKSVESALQFIPEDVKKDTQIKMKFAQLPTISCYGREINQVLVSVFLNAFQMMEGKGLLRIETLQKENDVLIIVRDTGPGIRDKDLKKIFDPFFTTKPIGEGTGLGLSTAYQVMKKHNGEINATNNPDQGAVFTIRIPIPLHEWQN